MATQRSEVPILYKRMFQDNVELAVQQLNSKLTPHVYVDRFDGKEKVYEDLEETDLEPKGRLQNSNPAEPLFDKRKSVKRPYKKQFIFDQNDDEFLGSLALPTSEVMMNIKAAHGRFMDADTLLHGAGTVYGGTEEPYVDQIELPSTQKVPVNYVKSGSPANSGMTPDKIIRAMSILKKNDIDPLEEEVCVAMDPYMEEDLITYVEDAGNDVWAKMISEWLSDKSKKLFNANVVMTNRNQHDAATDISTAVVWSQRRGIYTCPGEVKTSLDIRPDKDHALQVSYYMTHATMRRFDKAVVTIACDRTP